MRRLAGLILALPLIAFAIGCWTPARAATLPTIGRAVSGEIDLLGKHVPLPSGPWWVASTGFGQVEAGNPGPYGAIGGVLLVRANDAGREFLLIHTNALPVRAGWGLPPECMNESVLLRSVAEPRNEHNGCSFVVATRAGWLTHARLPALRDDDPSVRALLPPWALLAGLRVSDRRDVLDIRYGIVPPDLPASTWFGDKDRLPPAQQILVRNLEGWAQKMRTTAIAALRDPADQVPAPPPLDLLGPEAKPPNEGISTVTLSLYKLASLRVPNSLLTLGLGWALAGNFYTGVEVMAWQGLTHSAVFMANELIWEWPRTTPPMRFVGEKPAPQVGPQSRMDRGKSIQLASVSSADLPISSARQAATSVTTYAVDGKLVPLPGAGWVAIASDSTNGVTATVLARVDGKQLSGLVVAHTNQKRRTAIFGTSSDCSRTDVSFAIVRYDTPEDGYCLYGKQVAPDLTPDKNAVWNAALQRLDAAGIAIPKLMMMVGARARTQENVLDVRYYFAPSLPLLNRDLGDTGLTADPLAALQSWADLMQEPMELGVRGRPLSADLQAPWPWEADAVNQALIDQTHGPLLALAAANAFDHATLDQQLSLADDALTQRERQRWSLWTRSAYKTATYKAAGWVDSFATSWLVTTSPSQGFLFATISLVVRPAMQYANEMAWSRSSLGKAPASLVPVDFPEIGREFR